MMKAKGSKSNNGAAVRLRGEGLQGCRRWSLRKNRMMIEESTEAA
jgi:hypothetical protein